MKSDESDKSAVQTIKARAAALAPELSALRRHLHANPELSFKETNTAAFVAGKLRELGLEPRTVAGTGVVAIVAAGLVGGGLGDYWNADEDTERAAEIERVEGSLAPLVPTDQSDGSPTAPTTGPVTGPTSVTGPATGSTVAPDSVPDTVATTPADVPATTATTGPATTSVAAATTLAPLPTPSRRP